VIVRKEVKDRIKFREDWTALINWYISHCTSG